MTQYRISYRGPATSATKAEASPASGRRFCSLLLLLAACLLGSPASAGVTPYGNFDLALVREEGRTGLDRGYNNWLGIRGEEDLGAGLGLTFNLQTRFITDTGQQERPRTFWQGESTVGLRSARLGTLRAGRALSPLWQQVWAYEPWANSGFNASLAAFQTGSYSSDGVTDVALGFADFSRISNGIFYSAPPVRGLQLHVASAVERKPGARSRTAGLSLNYARGPLTAMLAHERNGSSDKILFLGTSYKVGPALLMLSYARHRPAVGANEHNAVLAGTYAIGAGTIRAGYGRERESGDHKTSMGYVYALSKRTNVYGDLYRTSATQSRNGIALGINHTF